jgi:hypothetical protein
MLSVPMPPNALLNPEEVLFALRKLVPDLTFEEWDRLVEDGRVEDARLPDLVEQRQEALQGLRDDVNRGRNVAKLSTSGEQVADRTTLVEGAEPTRDEVLSLLFAQRADADPRVIRFRDAELSEGLLKPKQVHAWISARLEPGTVWEIRPRGAGALIAPRALRVDHLQYVAEDASQAHPVKHGSSLDRLRVLSAQLAERYYPWSQAQASTFVLTGGVPLIPHIRWSLEHGALSAGHRLVMRIDPELRADRVAQIYKRLQRSVIPGRQRAASRKTHHLAVFLLAEEIQDATWESRLRAWNDSVPSEWRYANLNSFAKQARSACERLLNPPRTSPPVNGSTESRFRDVSRD